MAWDGKYLWICDWKEAKAFKIDPSKGNVLESIELPCARPEDIVWADGHLFVCDATERQITFVHRLTNQGTGVIAVRGDDASMDDVFHRWCEVYLPNYGWIPVGPSGGDSPVPANQARAFGMLGNKYFVTTHGGGDSKYLGWDYNYSSRSTFKGKSEVREEAFALWEPVVKAPDASSELSGKACKPK